MVFNCCYNRNGRRHGSGLGTAVGSTRQRLSRMKRSRWLKPRWVAAYKSSQCAASGWCHTKIPQAKEVEEEEAKTGPTPEQLTAIKAAIANASTLEVCGCWVCA